MKLWDLGLGRQMSVAGGVVMVKDLVLLLLLLVCLIMGLLRRCQGEGFWEEEGFRADEDGRVKIDVVRSRM